MSDRIVGYILLAIGIITMVYATLQIIFIFTGRAEPPQIITYEMPTTPASNNSLMGQLGGNPMPEIQIIDPDAINHIINLSAYYLIMQMILALGYKLATLGVSMLRPIVVEVKNRQLEAVVEENKPI